MSVAALRELLAGCPAVVLTGAGLSVESGIPAYRGEGARLRAPMEYREFAASEAARRRYWARSFVGYFRFERAQPNRGHRALVELERRGVARGVITQNVDGLHRRAESVRLVELHGALAEVRCVGCGTISSRSDHQARLAAANPGTSVGDFVQRPDGDAEIEPGLMDRFQIVACETCGGILRPNVVFFGENVPRPITEAAYAMFAEAAALLVVGTSLTVFSGHRFVRAAHEKKIPIAIVNLGPTRGDPFATLKIEEPAGEVLESLAGSHGVACR